jgi:hypothetical protein
MGIEGAADVCDPRSVGMGKWTDWRAPGRGDRLGVNNSGIRACNGDSSMADRAPAVGYRGGSSDIGENHRAQLGS